LSGPIGGKKTGVGYTPENALFAGGINPVNTPQTIPVGIWTAVKWENVPGNRTDLELQADKQTWRRYSNIKRSSGLWMTIGSVAWENTDPALIGVHRRRIRLVNYVKIFPGFWTWLPFIERECAPYIPTMPGKSELSYGDCIMQDGYDWAAMQAYPHVDMQIQVWHNAEVPIRIMPEGAHGPLLMAAKLSEFEL
jgi:hypothetical protein